MGVIFHWLGHEEGEGNGTPLQYSCLANPMDGGAWWAAVHGVTKSRTRLSDFTFNFHFHALEKEMATHSSVLAWRIPGTGEPGGLPSMGSHTVRHDWSDLAAAAVALTLGFIDINLLIHTTTLRSVCPLNLIFQPWGRLSLREMSHWADTCHNWESNPGQSLDLSFSLQI